MSGYTSLVIAHIGAGTVALLCFWIAAVARKGSPLHRRVGQCYLIAMLAILLTALPMAALILLSGRIGFGIFFAYLVLITATTVWQSWRAIRLKSRPAAFYNRSHLLVAVVNIVVGLLVCAVGISRGAPLLIGFSWVGVLIGVAMLRQHVAGQRPANWWLREHYGAMIGNGIATHISFLGIGLRHVPTAIGQPWLADYSFLAWVLPLVVAFIVAQRLDRRYRVPALRAGHGPLQAAVLRSSSTTT